ncbi:YrrS family protein [Pseudalkalibacillus decolorationis]|uniref:YrrS family protein n=1 Tax=Pseudalkalibacillus decolorationis TaxID=163879 RepID=UPI0021480CF1|nr:DUF1510 family protein [Pseudalkalibacillus decolorationis]
MKKDFSFQTRHERTQKKKQNLILNLLIGVVFIAILAIGASLLFSEDEKASNTDPSNENTTTSEEEQQSDANDSKNNSSDSETKEPSDDTNKESVKDEEDKAEDDSDKSKEDGQEGTYKSAEEGGPDASLEPVGTVQEGEHVSSYDTGSVDWKEKKEALQYATGIPADQITYWRIENGGSPQKSKGIVSRPEDKANPFVVMLQWVDGEGWKPISVERVPGAAGN